MVLPPFPCLDNLRTMGTKRRWYCGALQRAGQQGFMLGKEVAMWEKAVVLGFLTFAVGQAAAEAPERSLQVSTESAGKTAAAATGGQAEAIRLPDPAGATAMPKPDRVWVDKQHGQVMVDGVVSLRDGYLEMFACPVGTKEHESVVAVQTRAQVVHAALLAIGAQPGHPVRFQPKFSPPSGARIRVEVRWQDAHAKWQSLRAQQWVLDAATGQVMRQPWVFAGSGFWTDPATGKQYYQADAGDFICVSNFTTAMLDIPIESSQSDDQRTFVANTKRIPPLGTPVRLVLSLEKKEGGKGKSIGP